MVYVLFCGFQTFFLFFFLRICFGQELKKKKNEENVDKFIEILIDFAFKIIFSLP